MYGVIQTNQPFAHVTLIYRFRFNSRQGKWNKLALTRQGPHLTLKKSLPAASGLGNQTSLNEQYTLFLRKLLSLKCSCPFLLTFYLIKPALSLVAIN